MRRPIHFTNLLLFAMAAALLAICIGSISREARSVSKQTPTEQHASE